VPIVTDTVSRRWRSPPHSRLEVEHQQSEAVSAALAELHWVAHLREQVGQEQVGGEQGGDEPVQVACGGDDLLGGPSRGDVHVRIVDHPDLVDGGV
jgi:hypothetical protein